MTKLNETIVAPWSAHHFKDNPVKFSIVNNSMDYIKITIETLNPPENPLGLDYVPEGWNPDE